MPPPPTLTSPRGSSETLDQPWHKHRTCKNSEVPISMEITRAAKAKRNTVPRLSSASFVSDDSFLKCNCQWPCCQAGQPPYVESLWGDSSECLKCYYGTLNRHWWTFLHFTRKCDQFQLQFNALFPGCQRNPSGVAHSAGEPCQTICCYHHQPRRSPPKHHQWRIRGHQRTSRVKTGSWAA